MKWPLKEIELIKYRYEELGAKKIAEILHRPEYRIANRYRELKRKHFKINVEYHSRPVFKFPYIPPTELGYVAGFIDGEGSLSLPIIRAKDGIPRYCSYKIQVGNKDPRPIEHIHEVLKIPWKIRHWTHRDKGIKKHIVTELEFIGAQRVQELLKHLTPHLVNKKEQAEIILQLFRQHEDYNWTISDWELVLKHSEANRSDTHPRRLEIIRDLKSFIKKLKST